MHKIVHITLYDIYSIYIYPVNVFLLIYLPAESAKTSPGPDAPRPP